MAFGINGKYSIDRITKSDFLEAAAKEGISERIAISIVKEYPKLDLLYNIYLSDEYDEKEKENLLENIQIGNKRLGPALSGKIYKFFTADKPDIKINN